MRTIILNKQDIVDNGKNNILEYSFPSSVVFKDSYVAVKQVSMYFSWYYISSALGNNTLQYVWYSGTGTQTTFTVTIPDGLYEISDINLYLQSEMISNGHYLIDNTNNKNIFFLELTVNASRYAVQVNTSQFKYTSASDVTTAGYAVPSNFNTAQSGAYPSSSSHYFNPKVIFPANFNEIVGYSVDFTTDLNVNGGFTPANSFVSKDTTTQTISYLSHDATTLKKLSPDVQPNHTILLNISNIDNPYASPTGILYSIAPDVAFGALISD